MGKNRRYDTEFKKQAVKLAIEVGQSKAAKELGIPENTLYGWVKAHHVGELDLEPENKTPQEALTLSEELTSLRHCQPAAPTGSAAFPSLHRQNLFFLFQRHCFQCRSVLYCQ